MFIYKHLKKWLDMPVLGLPVKFLYPSPSKIFSLRKLRAALEDVRGIELALDVACAHFKYRPLFTSRVYVGVDRNPEMLAKGEANFKGSDSTYGLETDLLALAKAPEAADLIVSTHTIAHLPQERWTEAVRALAECVRPNGYLFFNVPSSAANAEIGTYLESQFGSVEKIRYANRLSIAMELFFDKRTHYKGNLGLIFLGLAAGLALLLSFIEEIKFFRKNGYYILFFARYKRSHDLSQRLQRLRDLDERNRHADSQPGA